MLPDPLEVAEPLTEQSVWELCSHGVIGFATYLDWCVRNGVTPRPYEWNEQRHRMDEHR